MSKEEEQEEVHPEIQESIKDMPSRTTKFICKVCGIGFDDGNMLDSHIAETHHPKRTVTINDIINGVFEGKINFPKTKAEIVKEIEKNKDKPEVTPDVIDTIRNLPDRRYNNEADLALGIEQQQQKDAVL
jgi:hypothetical protein